MASTAPPMQPAMSDDDLRAALRRAILERDQARWVSEQLKRQNKTLRQELRHERAEHRKAMLKLEAEKNRTGYIPPAP